MIHEIKHEPDTLLETLDLIRSDIESGDAVAFAGVTISPEDELTAWIGMSKPVSKLRITGAITALLHSYFDGLPDD